MPILRLHMRWNDDPATDRVTHATIPDGMDMKNIVDRYLKPATAALLQGAPNYQDPFAALEAEAQRIHQADGTGE